MDLVMKEVKELPVTAKASTIKYKKFVEDFLKVGAKIVEVDNKDDDRSASTIASGLKRLIKEMKVKCYVHFIGEKVYLTK
jgi:hypothetical protein